MSYFPPCSHSKNKIQIELDLSNYAIKFDLKNATDVDKSQYTEKDDLANLKSEADKLDIDKLAELDTNKLKTFPVDLKKLGYVVDKKYVKKGVYDKLVKKVDAIDTNKLAE